MHLPRVLARFNRYVTNPIQRRWAGVLFGFGIIEHVGRRSGRAYGLARVANVRPLSADR